MAGPMLTHAEPSQPVGRPARTTAPLAARRPSGRRGGRLGAAVAHVALIALVALLPACGEKAYYRVDLNGNTVQTDADGVPLPGQSSFTVASPHGPMGGGAMPGGTDNPHAAAGGTDNPHAMATDPDDSGVLRVVVTLKDGLGIDPARFTSLFVFARRDPTSKLPDLMIRVLNPEFPARVELTAANAMSPGGTQGAFSITARLDADSDVKAGIGDVQGISAEACVANGPPATVVLNQVLDGNGLGPRPEVGGAPPSFAGGGAPAAGGAPFAGGGGAPFAGGGAPQPSAEDLAGPRLKARIELDPSFASMDGKATLFVMVRSAKTARGMPLAVRRVEGASFPLEIEMGTENVPLQVDNKAEMLQGDIVISARLSMSGGVIGATGDLETDSLPIQAGGEAVTLALDHRRQ